MHPLFIIDIGRRRKMMLLRLNGIVIFGVIIRRIIATCGYSVILAI